VTHGLSVIVYRVGQCLFETFSVEERVHWQHLREVRAVEKMLSKLV
jgi:hypothetical protein